MQKISLQKAKEEIKNLFIEKGVKFKNDNKNDEKSTSFISNNTFFIDKRQMEREDVAAMLVNYFIGKQVETRNARSGVNTTMECLTVQSLTYSSKP